MVSATVSVQGGAVVIEPKGKVSRMAALKRRMSIPLAFIIQVDDKDGIAEAIRAALAS